MVSQKGAYAEGFDNGYGIARSNGSLLREYGKQKFIQECLETESEHFRQFSPFEFTAAEFNRSRNSDALWESYEDGVHKGILKWVAEQSSRTVRKKAPVKVRRK